MFAADSAARSGPQYRVSLSGAAASARDVWWRHSLAWQSVLAPVLRGFWCLPLLLHVRRLSSARFRSDSCLGSNKRSDSSNRKVKRAVGILILIDPDKLVLGFCAAGRAQIFHYLGVN